MTLKMQSARFTISLLQQKSKKDKSMKSYIKKNLKLIIAVTAMLFCVGALIVSNEIRAQMLPVASEALTVVYCEIENEVCEYTGQEIENEIHRIVFTNKDDERIVCYQGDFKIKNYLNNIEGEKTTLKYIVGSDIRADKILFLNNYVLNIY